MQTAARWCLRHPAAVNQLPRLLATDGKSALTVRQPWLPFLLIDFLDTRLRTSDKVFEYGGGGSTAWFSDRVAEVHTVEDSRAWFDALSEALDTPRVHLMLRSPADDHADYVSAVDDFADETFDVVVVDGRQRVRCFERATSKVRPGGLLVIDDIERTRYAPVFDMVSWPRRRFSGFAPCKGSIAHTAVFTKP